MAKQRHKYEYDVEPNTTGAKVVRMVGVGKRVLELGPGPGSITRLLKHNSCRVTALEYDLEAVDIVSPYCDVVHMCNLNNPDWPAVLTDSDKFQVIVAADVLEHLHDPWALLQKLHPLLAEDGQVVVSLPNAGHNAVISCLLTNDFEYRPSGLLDRTHLRFFGITNIQKMFEDAGFKIVEAEFVVAAPEETEFAERWRSLPTKTRRALSCNKFGAVYQVVVKAVPKSVPGKGMRLNSLHVPPAVSRPDNVVIRGKQVLGSAISFLGARMHDRISRVLEYVGLKVFLTGRHVATRLFRKIWIALLVLAYVIPQRPDPRRALHTVIRLWRQGGLSCLKHTLREFVSAHIAYARWVKKYDILGDADRWAIRRHIETFGQHPTTFSVVVLPGGAQVAQRRTLDSMRGQLYPRWELLLAGDPVLVEDARVRTVAAGEDKSVHDILNRALTAARGEFVIFAKPGDQLAEHALYLLASEIERSPGTDFLYSDEDRLDDLGRRFGPHFKPDWNPDLLLGWNYIGGLVVYRLARVKAIGGIRPGFNDNWDWDLTLRTTEDLPDSRIRHVPHVLCHRPSFGIEIPVFENSSSPCALLAVGQHLKRGHRNAEALPIESGGLQVRYMLPEPAPLVSIIIPTRNGLHLLKRCVESIFRLTQYQHYELIVVDNQSDDPATLAYLDQLTGQPKVRMLSYDAPFNFAAIINFAVKSAEGLLLCLLNNDTEVISRLWLDELVGQALRAEVGAVGAMLYFPDDTIQHAGVILGIGRGHIAGHWHLKVKRGVRGYSGRTALTQDLSAVTGACMVMRKSVFDEVGGMDSIHLPVDFNDVDLCLRIREQGYRIVWTPFAELYHHESASRGKAISLDKRDCFRQESEFMRTRWGRWLDNDPAYNPNLTLDSSWPFISHPPRIEKPWRLLDKW